MLNPLVGELKGDDVPARVRMRCYRALHDGKLLGKGDKDEALWQARGYDLTEVFELVGLDIKMLYGGPKEAVMHAIYRQNLGFTDIVIGRKHADAPFDDGKPIWGDFDAQEIFKNLRGDLRIRPCNIGFAAYFESAGRVDLMERHPDEQAGDAISGSKIREALDQGRAPRRAHPAPGDRRHPDRVLQDRRSAEAGWSAGSERWKRPVPTPEAGRAAWRPYYLIFPSTNGTSNTLSCMIGPWPK